VTVTPEQVGRPLPRLPSPQRISFPTEGWLRSLLRLALALAATLAVFAALIAALGENPLDAFDAMWEGAIGNKWIPNSGFNFGQTAMIASLLICTGLAAAIPFRARLWNVGGEGQLWFGAFAAIAIALSLPPNVAPWQAMAAAVAGATFAGAFWGFIPGILKATINANEVITSLMLVFVAIQIGNYAISTLFPSQSNQTESIPFTFELPNIWTGTLVTVGAPIAAGAAVLAWIVMSRTPLGFQIRAVGLNANAARMNGMSTGRVAVLAFTMGGAFGGLAGGIAVMGINGALISGFSANFGFIGIAVALVARLSPIWILPSAFLFAALRTGSNGLQATTGISTSMGEVLVATFVILLLAFRVIRMQYAEAAQ
jgi:ABC-type uncharacterized transport system permease subunit